MGRKRKQLDVEKDAPPIGHNSALNADERKKLAGYRDEIVRLELQKRELGEDIKTIYSAVKDAQFGVKALRRVVKATLRTEEEKVAEAALVDLTDVYLHALGMLSDTPLGQAAMQAAGLDQTASH